MSRPRPIPRLRYTTEEHPCVAEPSCTVGCAERSAASFGRPLSVQGGAIRTGTRLRRGAQLEVELLETRDCPSVTVTDPGDRANWDGDTVNLAIVASDDTNLPLMYSATHLPAGLTINQLTGVISGTVGATADLNSSHSTTVTATDGLSGDSKTIDWTILNPVILPNPGNQTDDNNGEYVELPAL